MNGKRARRRPTDWRAASLIQALMADRGWSALHVEAVSYQTGHPQRGASNRSIYRVINTGYVPLAPVQFEIAAAFGLLPSHIWGTAQLPERYAYLRDSVAA